MTTILIQLVPMAITVVAIGLLGYLLRWPRAFAGVVTCTSSAVVLTATLWFAQRPAPEVGVVLSFPSNRAEVSLRGLAAGTVTDRDAHVYVLIHPRATDRLYVQNRPVVADDGRWQVEVFFGTEQLGVGEEFEVLAVATREGTLSRALRGNRLSPGQQLKGVPPHLSKSSVSVVTRTV